MSFFLTFPYLLTSVESYILYKEKIELIRGEKPWTALAHPVTTSSHSCYPQLHSATL